MSRLDQVLNGQGKPADENEDYPVFDSFTPNQPKKKGKRTGLAIVLFIFSGLILSIYLPALFIRDKSTISNELVVSPDVSIVKEQNDYLSTHSSDDFDNDRLDNAAEEKNGTNPYNSDTDGDGLSDYYEIYTSKTDPIRPDDNYLTDYQKSLDEKSGAKVNSPFSCNGVIMWADDAVSKARGCVVATPNGYHFNRFTGYAQFPSDTKIYAYTIDHGKYELLPYRETEKAWRIENGVQNVYIMDKPLEEVVDFHFFGASTNFSANWFSSFWAFILPNHGWLTAEKKTLLDVTPDTSRGTTAQNMDFEYDLTNYARLGKETNSLSELQFVRTMIQNNRCVMVSLFSKTLGEYRGIIYGYTPNGELLIMDEKTKSHVGTLHIQEQGRRTLNEDGEFILKEYFTWYGLGFSYQNYDRISFFSVAKEPAAVTPDTQTVTEEPTEDTETTETTETTEEPEVTETTETTETPTSEEPQKAQWVEDEKGWWYQRADGTYPKNTWEKIGKFYYHFDQRGYLSVDTTIDGIYVDQNGRAEKDPTAETTTSTTESNKETSPLDLFLPDKTTEQTH